MCNNFKIERCYFKLTMSTSDASSVPQSVEELRLQACSYENLAAFFAQLKDVYDSHQYDADLVVNVDVAATNSRKRKRNAGDSFDSTTKKAAKSGDQISLCCGVSASGKPLMPVFIMNRKYVTVECEINTSIFDCGSYGLAYSPSGWDNSVGLSLNYIVVQCLSNLIIILKIGNIRPMDSKLFDSV